MSKTVVFHIISRFDLGGAEQVALNIASSPSTEFEHHIIEVIRGCAAYTRVFIDEMRRRGIHYHRSPVGAVNFHYVFERLAAVLFPLWAIWIFMRRRPQVLHSHTEVPDMAVWCLLRLFPHLFRQTKLVRTIHNTRLWTGLPSTGRRFERFVGQRGINVAISPSVFHNYADTYAQAPVIIYNGVPRVPQKPWPGIVEGRINILFAGRLEPQKGITKLIEIVSSLADDSRYHFHIIGDGSLRPDVEKALSRQTNVTLSAPVYGLSAYLASFDALLMPSEFEGLSIMSIEASLEALPVICNRCPGLADTLPPGWPLGVTGNDINEYMHIFCDVLPTADLAAFGRKSRRFASANFGLARMQTRYEEIYMR